mgnify:CR=1 FL=1
MRGFSAKPRLVKSLFLAFALGAGLGLTACSDIDDMFADDSDSVDVVQTADATAPNAAPPSASALPGADTSAPSAGSSLAPVATITPITIDPGSDTGTAVNKTIQSIRAQVAGLQQKLATNAQRLADLRNSGAGAAGAYH